MEKSRRVLTIVIIVLLALNLIFTGIIVCGGHCKTMNKHGENKSCMHKGMDKCKGDSNCCMMKTLNLTKDQMTKMEGFKKEFMEQQESFEDTMEYMQSQLLQEIKKEKPDQSKIKEIK
jgi:Spy/CpxP family protein refolding chaperone